MNLLPEARRIVEIHLKAKWLQRVYEVGPILPWYKSQNMHKIKVCVRPLDHPNPFLGFDIAFQLPSEPSIATENPFSETNVNNVTQWLQNCDVNHPSCRALSTGFTPSRLLEVKDKVIRLIENGPSDCQYVALSYCWGQVSADQKGFLTTNNNVHTRQFGFSLTELPRTLQDVVHAVRALNIGYIWVDALCIIQDDKEDWRKEASKMGKIYRHAYLTIAATNSNSSFDGFLKQRQPSCNASLGFVFQQYKATRFEPAGNATGTFHFRYPLETDVSNYLSRCEWNQRGWTLQEQLLSSSVLYFSEDVIHWECPEVQGIEHPAYKLPQRLSYATLLAESNCLTTKQRIEQKENYLTSWYKVVTIFSKRSLTVPGDKLPALDGLASTFKDLVDDESIFGLWKSDLHRGLLWYTAGQWILPPCVYRAPTWSWACRDGSVLWDESTFTRKWQVLADIHLTLIHVSGVFSRPECTPCHHTNGTKLEISAPIAPFKEVLRSFLEPADVNDFDDAFKELDSWDEFDELGALVIDSNEDKPLLLEHPTGKCGCFRRVGWFIHQQTTQAMKNDDINDDEDEYEGSFFVLFPDLFSTKKVILV
ncbi:HET-domain-containing protein [Xylariaceae sp. AK1471]|nr:HET-domain-containing protein [Xylariaceae sp. AK1471]